MHSTMIQLKTTIILLTPLFFTVILFNMLERFYIYTNEKHETRPAPLVWQEVHSRDLFGNRRQDFSGTGTCRRVEHLAYIKTYKTGSSTMTNLLFRFALRHNKTVLMFNDHLQRGDKAMYPIHLHPLFKNTTPHNMKFSLLMEHVYHNNEMIQYMMPSDTHYFSSLRHPLMQLKSHLHYRGMDDKQEPVLQFLQKHNAANFKGMESHL